MPIRFRATLLAVVVAVAVYAPTLPHGFVFDDGMEIVDNEHIRSPANLVLIATSAGWEGAGTPLSWYRPLTTYSYALNFAWTQLEPWSYHLVNIALHGLVTALVLALASTIGLPSVTAALAAIIFAIHPVHVEVVANISGRKDLLAAAFVLGAVLSHRQGRSGSSQPATRVGWALLAALLALGGMFSKETGAVVLALILLTDLVLPRNESRSEIRTPWLSYSLQILALAGYLSLRLQITDQLIGWNDVDFLENPLAGAALDIRLATALAVLGRGFLLLMFPLRLSPDYSWASIPLADGWLAPATALSVAGLLIFTALSLARRHQAPRWLWLLGWYLITILPAANIVVPIGTIFGERLLYLPSVAFCLGIAVVFGNLLCKHDTRTMRLALAAVGIMAVLRTLTYAAEWSSDAQLFSAAVQRNPASSKLQHRWALVLSQEGRVPEAMGAYRRALEIYPANLPVALNLGQLLEDRGDFQSAEAVYRKILAHRSDSVHALYRLASLLRDTHRTDEAAPLWTRALAIDPGHFGSLLDLGTYYYLGSDWAGAREMWERAARAQPGNATLQHNLSLIKNIPVEEHSRRE